MIKMKEQFIAQARDYVQNLVVKQAGSRIFWAVVLISNIINILTIESTPPCVHPTADASISQQALKNRINFLAFAGQLNQ